MESEASNLSLSCSALHGAMRLSSTLISKVRSWNLSSMRCDLKGLIQWSLGWSTSSRPTCREAATKEKPSLLVARDNPVHRQRQQNSKRESTTNLLASESFCCPSSCSGHPCSISVCNLCTSARGTQSHSVLWHLADDFTWNKLATTLTVYFSSLVVQTVNKLTKQTVWKHWKVNRDR